MSPLRKGKPCIPGLDPQSVDVSSRWMIIIVVAIQVFTGFLITRGYTLEAALAASGATCVLASQIGHRVDKVRPRRIA